MESEVRTVPSLRKFLMSPKHKPDIDGNHRETDLDSMT